MIEIIPAILTNDPDKLRDLLSKCEGVVERVSIDIIDGQFADNKTIDPSLLEDIETNLKIDYQLMVKEPINWIERCVRGQADRIIGHVEQMQSQQDFVDKVMGERISVGLALDLPTPVSSLDKDVLSKLDTILVMSVPAGFGGQKFSDKAIDKIRELKKLRDEGGLNFKIQDDGGITLEKVDDIHFLGVDEVSIGRRILKGDLNANVKRFEKMAHNLDLPHAE
jgi:ribulose-phosphate 3-epimerase